MNKKTKYFTDIIEKMEQNSFFDLRENKGCEEKEIINFKKNIQPYFAHLPVALEEDLRLFGKYRCNQKGTYNTWAHAQVAGEFGNVDLKTELDMGFLVLCEGHFGILTDDYKFLEPYVLNKEKRVAFEYDNPPYYHKTGDEEDDDIEVVIVKSFYNDVNKFELNRFFDKYTSNFEQFPILYKFKQTIIELYSEIEIGMEKMPVEIAEKYERITYILRLKVQTLYHVSSSIAIGRGKVLWNEFHCQLKSAESSIDELKNYCPNIKLVYHFAQEGLKELEGSNKGQKWV